MTFRLSISAALLVLTMNGCISYPSADGTFTGTISTVEVQTADQQWHRAYLFQVKEGPEWAQGDNRLRWKSVGTLALLVRDRRGNVYDFHGVEPPTDLILRGSLFDCVADVNDNEPIALKGGGMRSLPNHCLLVKSLSSQNEQSASK